MNPQPGHDPTRKPLSQSQKRRNLMLRIVLPLLLLSAVIVVVGRWDDLRRAFKVTTIADTHLLGHLAVNGAIPVPRGRFEGEEVKLTAPDGSALTLRYVEKHRAFLATSHNHVRVSNETVNALADWLAGLERPAHEADRSGPEVGVNEISPTAGSGTRLEVTIPMGTSIITYALVANDRYVRVADEASVFQASVPPLSTDISAWMVPLRSILAAAETPKLAEITYQRHTGPDAVEDIRLIQQEGIWFVNQPGSGKPLAAAAADAARVARLLRYAQSLPFKGPWPTELNAEDRKRMRRLSFDFGGGKVRNLSVGDPYLFSGREAPVLFEGEPGVYAIGFVQAGELMPATAELLPQPAVASAQRPVAETIGPAGAGLLVIYVGHMNDTLKLTPNATERTLEAAIRSAQSALARIDKDSKRFVRDGGALRAVRDAASYYSDWRDPADPTKALMELKDFPISPEAAAEVIQTGRSLAAGSWSLQPVVIDEGLFVVFRME